MRRRCRYGSRYAVHQGSQRCARPSRAIFRPGETGDQAPLDRVAADREDDRDRRGRAFGHKCRNIAAACQDHVDLAADEVGGQCRQPIIVVLRPAVFDRHALLFFKKSKVTTADYLLPTTLLSFSMNNQLTIRGFDIKFNVVALAT